MGDQSGKVYALSPDDGSLLWTFDPEVNGPLNGEMALATDGTLYAGIGSMVFAINPDGSEFWSFDAGIATKGIVVGPGGVVFVTEANGGLNALNPDGSLKWRVVIRASQSPVIFGEDGTIYFGGTSAPDITTFFAIDPDDGSVIWDKAVGMVRESPSIGPNGDIYVPTANNTPDSALIALDPADGSEIWRFEVDGRVLSSPAVGLDGVIYFGTDGDKFYALRPDGTQLWMLEVGGDIQSSPTIGENGCVYFGSVDDKFYAVQSSSFGLAASAWPKKQRDVRNTGQFGSDTSRRRFFAPHAFDLRSLDLGKTVLTMHHTGNPALAGPAGTGTTANFRVDVRDRDGALLFSLFESVEPGATKKIDLVGPVDMDYQGSVVIDAPIKDGIALAPFLTWILDLDFDAPLRIGAFFSDPRDASQVHFFPAEASQSNGLGIAVQNIGDGEISCTLDFLNGDDGTAAGQEIIPLAPLGSFVDFFNDSVPEGFEGSGRFTCDAPVVAVAVNQDSDNRSFPTDRLTVKGLN